MRQAWLLIMVFVCLWAVYNAYLLGILPASMLPFLEDLSRPESISHLGDSAAALDSLFSSMALALGLVAVLMQGRGLELSRKQQEEQGREIEQSRKHQEMTILLSAYSTYLDYLLREERRLRSAADEIFNRLRQGQGKPGDISKGNKCNGLADEYMKKAKRIDGKIEEILKEREATAGLSVE